MLSVRQLVVASAVFVLVGSVCGCSSRGGDADRPSDGGTSGTGGALGGQGGSSAGTAGTVTRAGASSGGRGGSAAGSGGMTTGTGGSTGGRGGSSAGPGTDDVAADMAFGVNIGNTLENTTAWETGWGQPAITERFIRGLAGSGIKTIRLPVAWDTYADSGVVPADKMARVRQVAQWIVDAEMYCIVNIHWDNGWIRNDGTANRYRLTNDVRQKFRSYWAQIAGEFADLGDRLVFEALNEEGEFYVNGNQNDGPDYAPLNELNQTFVDTVRAAGGSNESRYLLIAGFLTDIAKTCVDDFSVPVDPAGSGKLLLSIHYYTPFPFCLMSEPADWNGIVYPATTWGTAAEQAELASNFQTLAAFTRSRGLPAVIGEFTVTTGSGEYVREPASRVRWLHAVSETAMSHGMVPVLWDTGEDVDRNDGSLSGDLSAVLDELGL